MNKNNCYNLGKITKTQGIKGNVYSYFDVDNPLDYKEMESVFVEINHNLVPFFIDHFQYKKGGQVLLKFEGVDSEDEAKQIVNCELYLPEEVLPQLSDTQFYYHEVPGYLVVDEKHGEVGKLVRVLEYASNPMLEIKSEKGEILLPIRDEFIQRVDRENKKLFVSSPEGLIELYTAPQKDTDTDC